MLIAFVLFSVTGCALTERNFYGLGGGGVRRTDTPKSNATVQRPAERHSAELPEIQPGFAIDPANEPRLQTNPQFAGKDSAASSGGQSQFSPGHSSLGSDSLVVNSKPSAVATGLAQSDNNANLARFANRIDNRQSETANPQGSAIRPIDGRYQGADDSSVIQLQGLEFDEGPGSGQVSDSSSDGTVRSWSDSPSERSLRSSTNAMAEKKLAEPGKATTAIVPSQLTPSSKAPGQLPSLPWQSDLEQLITRVERDLSQSKSDQRPERQNEFLRKQAQLRLLYLMAQRQEDALTVIPGIDPTQQEYWQQMIWALSNSFDVIQFPELTERAGQTVTPLSAALRLTREEAAISIKNMTFCRKISYFGNYERFPRNEFTPGYEVLLYTEIENFVSTPTVDGEYRTSLKSLIEITDSAGNVVWTKGFPPTEDFCRNPRRDYFHNYQFHIPEDLATGTYSLKLTIVDELSHKRASNSLNFVLK